MMAIVFILYASFRVILVFFFDTSYLGLKSREVVVVVVLVAVHKATPFRDCFSDRDVLHVK